MEPQEEQFLVVQTLSRLEGKVDTLLVQGANHEPRISALEETARRHETLIDQVRSHMFRAGGVLAVAACAAPLALHFVH